MFAATEFLSTLGLGSQVVMGASLAIVAVYVYRAVGVARVVAGVGGMIASHALVLLVVGALAISLGWVAPNAGVAMDHVRFALSESVDLATGPGRKLFRWIIGQAAS